MNLEHKDKIYQTRIVIPNGISLNLLAHDVAVKLNLAARRDVVDKPPQVGLMKTNGSKLLHIK